MGSKTSAAKALAERLGTADRIFEVRSWRGRAHAAICPTSRLVHEHEPFRAAPPLPLFPSLHFCPINNDPLFRELGFSASSEIRYLQRSGAPLTLEAFSRC